MSTSFENINRLQQILKDLKPLKAEDQERLDRKFRLEFNYNSNHIEGNTLTYGETKLLLLFDDVQGNHTLREYEEMKNHDVAYKMIEEWAINEDQPLTEQKIKELNEILLVRPFWKEAITPDGQATRRLIKVGNYKDQPNSVRLQNGEIFHYASPTDTPILMHELIDWYRSVSDTMHPVELAAMLHYKFVSIHPFDDGNGRISRLLVNYVLLKNDLPPVIIKSSDKSNYLRVLHLADVGNIDPFIKYLVEQVEWSLEISVAAARGENIEEKGDWEKELDLIKKSVRIDPSKKINKRYDVENLSEIINTTLYSLIANWEDKLEKFDAIFFERNSRLFARNADDIGYRLNLTGNTFEEVLVDFFENDLFSPSLIDCMSIQTSYYKIRSHTTNNHPEEFKAGEITFNFHSNAYEISFGGVLPLKSFFYGEYLSDVEIEEITNKFSSDLILEIHKTSER